MNILTVNLLFSTLVLWIGIRLYVVPTRPRSATCSPPCSH
jgi:hypothetical protein